MSVIKCAQCGFQMGDGAFSNCPRCNKPVDADATPVADDADTEDESEAEDSEEETAEEDATETA